MILHGFSNGIVRAALAVLIATAWPGSAQAHGSVTPDADLCIIRIGFYRAHFKVYLPATRQHQDYCEDLPDTGRSVFVMEYEHDGLADVPIEFRIIENVTGQGRFTNASHVAQIENIDDITVLHHPPAIQRDVFTIAHEFPEPGEFVGIVSVSRGESSEPYVAVFPFEVGYTGFGYWPWVLVGLLVLQCNYFWMNRRSKRLPAETPHTADA